MSAIAKTGIRANIAKLIGTIAGQILVIMEELVLTKSPISIVLVLQDLEVSSLQISLKHNNCLTMKKFISLTILTSHFYENMTKIYS